MNTNSSLKKNKMKILILEGTSKLGGAQFDNILIQRTTSEEFCYYTICPNNGDLYNKMKVEGNNVEILPMPKLISTSFFLRNKPILNPFALVNNFLSYFRFAKQLTRYIKTNKYDLLVTNGMNPHLYGGIASKFAKTPVVFRLMDVIREDMLLGFARKVFQAFASIVKAKIVVPSNAVAKAMFSDAFSKSNVKVIYNATDLMDFNLEKADPLLRELYNIDEGCVVFGCYSRLTPWKGHKTFVNAAISLLNKGVKAKFLIVGGAVFGSDNFLNSLKVIVAKSGHENDIIFTGFRYDMANCIKSADIVVVPSIYPDPCPRVMVESMALAKPIIGSDIGGIPEVIKDNETGLIFKPNDSIDLQNKFEYFLKNKPQILIMGENGFARQEKLYRLDQYQSQHEYFFNKTVEQYK